MDSVTETTQTTFPGQQEYYRDNVMVRVTRTPKEMPTDLAGELKALFQDKLNSLSGLVSGLVMYQPNTPSTDGQAFEFGLPLPEYVSMRVSETPEQININTLKAWASRYLHGFTTTDLLSPEMGVGIDLLFFEPNSDLTKVLHAWRLRGIWISEFSTIDHGIEREEDGYFRTTPVEYGFTLRGEFDVSPDVYREAQSVLDNLDRGTPGGPGGDLPGSGETSSAWIGLGPSNTSPDELKTHLAGERGRGNAPEGPTA